MSVSGCSYIGRGGAGMCQKAVRSNPDLPEESLFGL